ncbi:Mra1p Ecym_7277 [Eremothecium cymbalariae DBVPG|uniref:Uncharacterized protein n=1 Tax=Eremothecium cymbalariae (strain CBS 270.75 / DBVPG 7215 / KCTC 17166 / NRRL Y-17582) TaxID=931890 RepID=G8JWA4_ERECY|nr:hypothetical protein Ecym_7277 [Eremothecium cymbalariae DBVPG\
MRATQLLLSAAKKKSGISIPVELTPLFLAVSVAVCSGCWFSFKHFAYDKSLRLAQNPQLSALDEVLKKDEE